MNKHIHKRYSPQQKKKSKFFLYFRLFVCFLIICAAFVLKNIESPAVETFAKRLSEELRIDEAIEAISKTAQQDDGVAEVFKEESSDTSVPENTETEPVFNSNFYIDEDTKEEIEREIDMQRKKEEEEAKKLSVETLSFEMSSEELHDDTCAEIFRIPPPSSCSYSKEIINFKFRSPLCGKITSKYGYRDHPIMDDANFHTGLDIAAKSGTDIASFADGIVIDSGRNSIYGNFLLVDHGGGIHSFYGHNSKLSVKKGERVVIGQKIAEVGSTGMSTGPHLHFEVRKNNIRLDPELYISPEPI